MSSRTAELLRSVGRAALDHVRGPDRTYKVSGGRPRGAPISYRTLKIVELVLLVPAAGLVAAAYDQLPGTE